MKNTYILNVKTDQLRANVLFAYLLAMPSSLGAPVVALKHKLRQALVGELVRGDSMDAAGALCDVVGEEAVALAALTGDFIHIHEAARVAVSISQEARSASSWRDRILDVHEMNIDEVSPSAKFVVAPFGGSGGYAAWFLYRRTMLAGGVTEAGAKGGLHEFKHHAKEFRVRIDGKVERVKCLPPLVFFLTLVYYGEESADIKPDWVLPERRAAFSRARLRFEKDEMDRLMRGFSAAIGPVDAAR